MGDQIAVRRVQTVMTFRDARTCPIKGELSWAVPRIELLYQLVVEADATGNDVRVIVVGHVKSTNSKEIAV